MDLRLSVQMEQLFVQLMCEFEPEKVYEHLRRMENCDIKATIALCRKYQISDASAYLLERTGDVEGALNLMLEAFTATTKELITFMFNNFPRSAEEVHPNYPNFT